MSRTYPKGGDVDPAVAERERMRQQTRELHEAAKDARDAARDLRAVRDQIARNAEAIIDSKLEELRQWIVAQSEQVCNQVNGVSASATEALDHIADVALRTEARIAGYKDQHEVGETVNRGIRQTIAELSTSQQFIDDVAAVVAEAVGSSFQRVVGRHGEVLVGTYEQMREFRRAGGDPGIVLDART